LTATGEVHDGPVICAFEASPPARRAVEAAAWLAGALRAPLEVIHVFDAGAQADLPRDGPYLDPVLRGELGARIDQSTRVRMGRTLRSVVEPLPIDDVKTLVLDGRVVPTLHDTAAQRRAMMLVSGTAARTGVEHVLVGSVARELAARAPCPVVAVPPEAAIAEPGPVLVGDDGSDHADRAMQRAAALAERLGRPLVRLHARGDDPVQELSSAGAEQRACLIAAGTRGRGPLRAELLGSVSTGLIQTAERPIMLVPASAGS
jgi:nucleotide-binding universal stress UspA family protein